MYTSKNTPKEHKNQPVTQKQNTSKQGLELEDNRTGIKSVKQIQLKIFKNRDDEKREHEQEILRLEKRSEGLNNRYSNLYNKESKNPYRSKKSKKNKLTKKQEAGLKAFNEMTELNKRIKELKQEYDMNDKALDTSAETWKEKGSTANRRTLYLGSAPDVTSFQDNISPKKRKKVESRILNAFNWSEGVNESWMRGGEESAARFSLLTQLTPEARNLVYKALKEKLSGKKFLEEVKQSLPEDRTLWHSKEKRPTYYAKELAHLIDNGYVLSQPITDDAPSPNTTAHFGKSLARILGANFERDINKKKQELTKPKDN